MSANVGIVLVSYNAANAVRVTLASLRAAKNEVSHSLVLVDNASREEERLLIRRSMERHVQEAGLPWRYVQQGENLGFSGGNNVGLRLVLEDPSITHVCLLNSDVVVCDGWLDRLLAAKQDIVSPITNKAESEQCVPVPYEIELERALDEEREALAPGVFDAVNRFAQRRQEAFRDYAVDCDATFFCVLLSRRVCEGVGELDETFFPGGFEDDDYCLRARKAGFPIYVARGVFLHHWGSASFGRLDFGYFSENAERNRAYLEEKHGIAWLRRYEKPFVSFAQDAEHAASPALPDCARREARKLLGLHAAQLDGLLHHYQRESDNLYGSLQRLDGLQAELTAERAQLREVSIGLSATWRQLRDCATQGVGANAEEPFPVQTAEQFASDVYRVVEDSFRMHAAIEAVESQGVARRSSLLGRAWSLIRHGVPFVLRLKGAVFLGGYPYGPREKDGYWQRIRAIDGMFDDRWRIYFDPEPLPGQDAWYDMPAQKTLVLRGGGGRLRRYGVVALVWLLAIRCRLIYFHSVLRMQDSGLGRLLRIPFTKRVLDVHGVVPEEFRMHDDFFNGRSYDHHEESAARRASVMVVVTESMRAYVTQKYGKLLRAEVLVLPIFPGLEPVSELRPYHEGRPVVVYAGGLHKWQQVPLMIDAIERTMDTCDHRFYCTDPEAVTAMLSEQARASGRVVVEGKTHEELLQRYRECHFGFLLRGDNVVNHVACPTKVVEYLAMGIVPIMDAANVGDFVGLGMQYVELREFVAGRLPSEQERAGMAAANFEVYGRLRAQREAGAARLAQIIGRKPSGDGLVARAMWEVGKLLPADTARGRVVRGTWHKLRGKPTGVQSSAEPNDELLPGRCDLLVQVGNFLAGGLENVVLDLNREFQLAGYKVCLLVLGDQGPAAEQARQQGVEVFAQPYSADAYRRWLAAASPKLVMSHYSVEGASICGDVGMPLVQVIHNIYLWVQGEELRKMRESATSTTLFVATSEFTKDYSVRRLDVPAERCAVVPSGIDIERFRGLPLEADRVRLRRQLGVPEDAFVFLNAAAINHQKNHLSLLRSFRATLADCPRAQLVVIGPVYERDLQRDCEQYVEKHGLGDRVTFVGAVADPHRYYAMADAYVHAAFFEGGPLTILEALASNLPVVTVATGLAVHFKGCRGVHVVRAHFDVAEYEGHITAMKSSPDTEREMAAAMTELYRSPIRPDLPAATIASFDRANAYRTHVDLVQSIVGGAGLAPAAIESRSWTKNVAEVG